MHLKSLTVKGFKSFASATTLRLEPGITCVVGPNGSGKSNVVDAIAWVLGEQGAKALRGGKMEDVIFAGTAGRAPLGRAEVTLTIDNTDGALPIDYTEVSITRRMFRSGESEYEINGNSLPAARHPGAAQRLRHRPGDARHRRPGPARRRAARQAGGPARLHRGGGRRPQAPQAQGKGAAQARRDADQPQPAHRPHRRAAPPAQAAGPAGRGGPAGGRHPGRPARRPAAAARRRPGHAARRPWTRRSPTRPRCGSGASRSRREHARGPAPAGRAGGGARRGRAAARRRPGHLVQAVRAAGALPLHRAARQRAAAPPVRRRPRTSGPAATRTSSPPRPSGCASRRRSCARRSPSDQERLAEAVERRQELERQLAEAEKALVAAVKAIADRREGLAKLTGQVNAARTRTATRGRGDRAAGRRARRRAGAGRGGAGRGRRGRRRSPPRPTGTTPTWTPGTPRRSPRTTRPPRRSRELSDAERAAEKDAAELEGPRGGARAGPAPQGRRRRAAGPGRPGARPARQRRRAADRRARATRPRWPPRWARSPTRSRSPASTRPPRRCALLKIARRRPGRAAGRRSGRARHDRLAGRAAAGAARRARAGRPTWSAARTPSGRRVHRALRDVVLVPDLAAATGWSPRTRELRAVTPDGDVLGAYAAAGGSGKAPSYIEVQAAVDEARAQPGGRRGSRSASCARSSPRPAPRWPSARRRVDVAAAAKRAAEGERNAAARRLAELGAAARSAQGRGRAARRRPGAKAEAGPRPRPGRAGRAGGAAAAGRGHPGRRRNRPPRSATSWPRRCRRPGRTRWRCGSPSVPPRSGSSSLAGRADSLAAPGRRRAGRPASAPRPAGPPGPAARRSPRRSRSAPREALARVAVSLADGGRGTATQLAAARTAREAELSGGARPPPSASAPSWSGSPARCTATRWPAPSSGCASSSWRRRRPRTSALDVETLIAEYGPDQLVPPTRAEVAAAEADGEPVPEPVPFDRPTQEKRAAKAERDLALLGKVNPLALEEFAALEERFKFLSDQLEDLKATRARPAHRGQGRGRPDPRGLRLARSRTPRASSSRSSRCSSRAARAGWCSPTPRTCSPPASRSRPGRRARRSSGCRCCPAASGR